MLRPDSAAHHSAAEPPPSALFRRVDFLAQLDATRPASGDALPFAA